MQQWWQTTACVQMTGFPQGVWGCACSNSSNYEVAAALRAENRAAAAARASKRDAEKREQLQADVAKAAKHAARAAVAEVTAEAVKARNT